jgi:type I restriction enzyme S subunit
LRAEQERELENLLYSKYINTIENAEWQPMQQIAPIIRRDVRIKENDRYPELGIRSFGRGTFHKPAITGIEIGTKKLYQIKEGDLLFSNVFAWEGAIAVAQKEDNNRFGSHRFISCVTIDNVLAKFLCFHFLSPKGLEKLMKIAVPIPQKSKQEEFVAILEKINQIRQAYKAQEAELLELLPALLDKAFKGKLVEAEKPMTITTARSYELEAQYFSKRKALGAYIINH